MKHTQVFQGKKYISAKRASEISSYSSDYIGQLCRAGKLDCKRLGRVWFVSDDSILGYKHHVSDLESFKNRLKNIHARKNDSHSSHADSDRISAKQASLMSGYSSDYIGQLCRSGKVRARMMGTAWYISKSSLMEHILEVNKEKEARRKKGEEATAKSSEVISNDANEVRVNLVATKVTDIEDVSVKSTVPRFDNSETVAAVCSISAVGEKPIVLPTFVLRFKKQIMLVAVFAVFVATLSLSVPIVPKIDQNASVLDSIGTTVSLLSAGISKLLSSVTGHGHLVTEMGSNADMSVTSDMNGLVVTNSGYSTTSDEIIKKQIKKSFSDDVIINQDSSGRSGTITPVFKNHNGSDYIYVMVPLVQNESP